MCTHPILVVNCEFCICFRVFVFMYPHPIPVVLTGGWKGEELDETFGDKLLVGHSQTFISYKEIIEILCR